MSNKKPFTGTVPVSKMTAGTNKLKDALIYLNKKRYLYIMLIPCIAYFVIFKYIPMYGIIIAFKKFSFTKGIIGSEWIGFDNFKYLFGLSDFYTVLFNSVYLSFLRLLINFPVPIILALMLNEMRNERYKRFTQTVLYLPHFISWVVIGGILVNFLSPTWGVVNEIIKALGFEPIFFMAKTEYFRGTVIASAIWKEAGWGTIIYLAAISGINPELYESSIIDGANRWQRLWYITLPSISSTIVIMLILRIGSIMHNGFEQLFVLQTPQNLSVSEVFETYTYRVGLLSGRYSFGTAVGLFTNTVGMIFLLFSNWLARRLGQESIW